MVVLTLAIPAYADEPDFEEMVRVLPGAPAEPEPRFTFTNDGGGPLGARGHDNQPNFGGGDVEVTNLVAGKAADGTAWWFAADAKGVIIDGDCAPEPCGPNRDPPLHATGVVEKERGKWRWVAWHITEPVKASDQAYYIKSKVAPDVLPRAIGAGAEDAVKLFEASIGDPKTFAATVSDRKDVVLYGSELRERTVGGAKVKAKLTKWKLGFKVRDGIQAGLAGKSVAWVAANVDATGPKQQTPAPYRLLALYEKTGTAWKLVQAHFSVDTRTYAK